nr:hypothetical protein [uncultured Desulfuromonas sp.]
MRTLTSLTSFVFLILLLSGCQSIPTDAEIQIQVAKKVLSHNNEKIFSLENFHKVNGLSVDQQTYIAEVEYDLVFRKGLEELSAELNRTTSDNPLAALGSGMELLAQLMKYGQFKAGDRIPHHEKFKLIKTEQGWRMADDFNL